MVALNQGAASLLCTREREQACVPLEVDRSDELVRILALANLAEARHLDQVAVHLLAEYEEVDVEEAILHGLAVGQHSIGKEAHAQDEEQVEQEQQDHVDEQACFIRETHRLLDATKFLRAVGPLRVAFMLISISHDLGAVAALRAHEQDCLVGLEQFQQGQRDKN